MKIGALLVASGVGAVILAVAAYGFGAAQSGTIASIVALLATAVGLAVVNDRHVTPPKRHPPTLK